MSYSAAVLADSPDCYLRLGEPSGATAADSSGNSLSFTIGGSYTLGSAGLLSGDADTAFACTAAAVYRSALPDPLQADFAFEVWIKTTQSARAVILNLSAFSEFSLTAAGKMAYFLYSNSIPAPGAASVNDGAAHHVVWTRESGSVKLYIDGVLDTNFGADDGYVFFSQAPTLAAVNAFCTTPFVGVLDEAAFYSAALSAARVAAHYAAGAPAGDTTPPTFSSPTIPTGGATIQATLSESGCTPASGTGGFTLAGTTATVASWAISGTTPLLTLSGTVYAGETVTLSYSRASTTDDIHDAATNYLADFSGMSVTNGSDQEAPLAAGTAAIVSSGPTSISVGATDATGGTAPYSYQWQRKTFSGGSYADISNGGGVSGATTLSLVDGSAASGTLYGYRLVYTDSAGSPATATSNAVTAKTYTGGSLTGGPLVGPSALVS